MATETVINRPAPFVETLGTDLAKQVTAQQGCPYSYNRYSWFNTNKLVKLLQVF